MQSLPSYSASFSIQVLSGRPEGRERLRGSLLPSDSENLSYGPPSQTAGIIREYERRRH